MSMEGIYKVSPKTFYYIFSIGIFAIGLFMFFRISNPDLALATGSIIFMMNGYHYLNTAQRS